MEHTHNERFAYSVSEGQEPHGAHNERFAYSVSERQEPHGAHNERFAYSVSEGQVPRQRARQHQRGEGLSKHHRRHLT